MFIVFFLIIISLNSFWNHEPIKADTTLEFTTNLYETISPDNFSADAIDRFNIKLNWTESIQADRTWVEYSEVEDLTWLRGTHEVISNTSDCGFIHSDLNPGTQYFYKAWSWNKTDSEWSDGVGSSAVTNPNHIINCELLDPSNGSIDQNLSLQCSILISDEDADIFGWSIECSNGQSSSATGGNDGIRVLNLNHLNFITNYTIWVNATDGYDDVSEWFIFTTREMFIPMIPDLFEANSIGTDEIIIDCSVNSYADNNYVEWNNISDWDRGCGNILYNGSESSFIHSNLDPHTRYYYQGWGWNKTDDSFSLNYSSSNNITFNIPPEFGFPSPNNHSFLDVLGFTWRININDDNGDAFDWSIECSNGQRINQTDDKSGIKELEIDGLYRNFEYVVWVNATDDFDCVNEWFIFSILSENQPLQIHDIYPENQSSFDLEDFLDISVNITDEENDLFDWYISTSPNVGNASNISSSNGIKQCNITGLECGNNYSWNLSIFDIRNQQWMNYSYIFHINENNSEADEIPKTLFADAGGPYEGFANAEIIVDGGSSYSTGLNITGYRWDFNDDGVWDTDWSNISTATITYNVSGNFTIRLEITDENTSVSDISNVSIVQYNNPPVLTVVKEGSYSLIIDESWSVMVKGADSDNDEIRFKIDWGDSSEQIWTDYYQPQKEISFEHQWNTIGTKTVRVLAEDINKAVSQWYTIAVVSVQEYNASSVEDQPKLLFTKTEGIADEEISFHAYDDGFIAPYETVVSVSWNFGDDTTGSGIQVSHSYQKCGEYKISCIYITDEGQAYTTEHIISIAEGSILSSSLNSLPVMWIMFFIVTFIIFVFFYFFVYKKQFRLPFIKQISSLKRFIPLDINIFRNMVKKTSEPSPIFIKSDPYPSNQLLNASQTRKQDRWINPEDEWDYNLFDPVTFAGVFYEMNEKKEQEQIIQENIKTTLSNSKFSSNFNEFNEKIHDDNDQINHKKIDTAIDDIQKKS